MLAGGELSGAVTNGSLLAAVGVSALVGLNGFLSLCGLPLVPGYLSYVAGLSGALDEYSQRRIVVGALLFMLGLTTVLVSEEIMFGERGASIMSHTLAVERALGAVTILMASSSSVSSRFFNGSCTSAAVLA